ncbi:uncharacterized protein LOC123206038 [Mangifera indica]|uniref:uncharacterized protein LOC123206038 n=1 Tax=Mangifera indica TaxID=29780 RepID=UPI001CF9B49C|nr:uncharacterized protein LOC123206038 [Mangifera indica]
MEINNNKILMREKLDFFGIIKETIKLPFRIPTFIIFFLTAFFPFFCFFLLHEIIFQHNLIQALKFMSNDSPCYEFDLTSCYSRLTFHAIRELIGKISAKNLISFLWFLGLVHLVDLLNTIITVSTASEIYLKDENESTSLKGIIRKTINKWTAIWNMGLVISILEENKHGDVALGVSAYLSRGSRKRGLVLQFMFSGWSFGLRILCILFGWRNGGSKNVIEVIAAQVCVNCLWNVMKWVAFVIYFYDCKKRFLEKKFDGAEGKA